MEAIVYLGARDVEDRMWHLIATPPRVFTDLAAAQAYTLSGIDKARELVEEQKKGLYSREIIVLANDFIEKLVGMRSDLVLLPGVNNEKLQSFLDDSLELRKFARSVEELQDKADLDFKMVALQSLGIFMCCVFGMMFPSLMFIFENEPNHYFFLFLLALPFTSYVLLGLLENKNKEKSEILRKKRRLAQHIARAANE